LAPWLRFEIFFDFDEEEEDDEELIGVLRLLAKLSGDDDIEFEERSDELVQ
jgi:hypothetical protein